MCKEPVEDLQSGINLAGSITVDVSEKKVEELLPDCVVLVLCHGSLNLGGEIANFVGKALSNCGRAVKGLED